MFICNPILKPGFLLLEAIIACTIMSLIVLYSAQYQWHTHMHNIRTHKQIQMLFDTYHFFEEKWYRSHLNGNKKCESGNVHWHMLPAIHKHSVVLKPIRVTCEYTIAGVEHTFNIISVV